jgi:hypothetical protein
LKSAQQTRYDNRPFLTCLVDDISDDASLLIATHNLCEKLYDARRSEEVDEFRQQLHSSLGSLACASPHVAWGIIQQSESQEKGESRSGLEVVLGNQLKANDCIGMRELSDKKKKELRDKLPTQASGTTQKSF